MAKPSKVSVSSNMAGLSYDDMVKVIKSVKGSSATYVGQDIAEVCTIRKIPTGIPTIDFLCSGGITYGKITILAGNISSAKSTTTQMFIASMQKYFKENNKQKMILYYDPEGSYDTVYAESLGIDTSYMIIKRTKVIEDAFCEIDSLVSTGFIGMLIVDSLDAMIARKVDDSDYGNTMGGTAGAVAMHLPSLFNKLLEHNVTTVFIKQARVKLDAYGARGEVLTFSGGKALRHFADTIFIMNRLSNRNLSFTPIKVKAEKTRSSRMGLTLDMPLGENGIDRIRDAVHLGIEHNLIAQAGAWMNYQNEEKAIEIKANGIEKFVDHLRNNKSDFDIFYNDIQRKIIYCESVVGISKDDIVAEDVD
jgi:recombination protein RecA